MKHCPNETCHYFLETGLVAEYQGHVSSCAECGAALVEGEAPHRELPPVVDDQGFSTTETLVTVTTCTSREDAEWIRDQLVKAGVPAVVEEVETELIEEVDDLESVSDGAVEAGTEVFDEAVDEAFDETFADEDGELYDVQVMASQTLPAMHLLTSLLGDDDSSEAESDYKDTFGTGGMDDADGGISATKAVEDETLATAEKRESENFEIEEDDDEPYDDEWEEKALSSNLVTNPLLVVFILFCVFLAIAYLILVGFPTGLFG